MKLKYQLFIVLLVASALLIALMLAVNSVSFQRQFINYVNSVEQKRLEPFIDELSSLHKENGHWNWLNKSNWGDLLRKHSVEKRAGLLGVSAPPPKRGAGKTIPKTSAQKSPSRKGKRPLPWLTLVNAERQLIIGRKNGHARMQWLPISTNDEVAGYLGLMRHSQLNRRVDQEFARQQKRNFVYAALAMALLSALISVLLASRLIRPLTAVNKSIGALSSGDFAYRASTKRKDEFGDLTRNINRLGETLEQNKAARQRWIAEISHELRTPVAVLQSEIEAIQDGIRTADTDTVQSLHAEILRLGRLIDDLHQLSVSDIGALDYRMSTVDLSVLVANFLGTHQHSLDAAQIRANFDFDNASIQGDEVRLNQLLDNLLQNTLRYTSAPGSLSIDISRKANNVLMTWSDSSPGVSEDDLAHLFEPLFRADKSRNRKTSGSGLGLAIVQKIVAAHDGSIAASHSDTGGLTLTLEFPALKQELS